MIWVHSPIQKLLEALALIFDENGQCTIPGFRDGVAEPTAEESAIYEAMRRDFDAEAVKRDRNIPHFRSHKDPADLFIDIVSGPILNIDGLVSGYTEGFTTVMPQTATAKLDVRIVPNQDMSRFFDNLSEVPRRTGPRYGRDPTVWEERSRERRNLRTPLRKAAERAAEAQGVSSQVWPISAACQPTRHVCSSSIQPSHPLRRIGSEWQLSRSQRMGLRRRNPGFHEVGDKLHHGVGSGATELIGDAGVRV